MFQKICAGITAASTLIIAMGVLYVVMTLHACNSGMVKGMEEAEAAGATSNLTVTSVEELKRQNERINRQLEQKLGSYKPLADLPAPPPPPKQTLPSGAPMDMNRDLFQQLQEDAERSKRRNDKGFPGHYDKK